MLLWLLDVWIDDTALLVDEISVINCRDVVLDVNRVICFIVE